MRLQISKSKNAASFYVIKTTYTNGKEQTNIVEKLGTLAELQKIHDDPIAWAKKYVDDLNKKKRNKKEKCL